VLGSHIAQLLVTLIFPLFCLSPARAPSTTLKPPKAYGVYIVAHRGYHVGVPENTLPAYRKAIELGVDFVEIDLRTTKDGKFIICHNNSVDKYVPGVHGKVRNFTFDQLRAFDIGSRIGPQWKGVRMPSFEEVLDLCKGRCGIYLDLKDADIRPVADLIKAHGMTHDVLWYASVGQLKELQAYCPECIPMPDPGPESLLPAVLSALHPQVVASVERYYSRSFAETCHLAGAKVIVDESDASCWQRFLDWHTDGIQTDDPEGLMDFLASRVTTPN